MISNSRIQITLLSFSFKNVYIIKKGNQYRNTEIICCLFNLKYTQRSAFKAIIYKANNTSIFKTNLPSLTSETLLPSFSNSFAFIFSKSFLNLQNLARMKYICKKSSNQEMFAISLSSCSRYNANFKFDQSVFAIHDSPPYF
jgi:hypothetical protein